MSDENNINHFYKVIALHEEKTLNWEELTLKVPLLPKGWFELSRFPKEDRVEFTEQFWFAKLPFMSAKGIFLEEKLHHFFEKVEDISIFLTQEKETSPFDIHMVYSLKNDLGFFHGRVGASEENINNLNKQFESVSFPRDYLAFLQIHDGFSKYDDTGLVRSKEMAKTYLKFQDLLLNTVLLTSQSVPIPSSTLIPFYESHELHSYQCFFTEWFPEEEMGNVSYDYEANPRVSYLMEDAITYNTFLDWLIEYLYAPY